jgi:hypothetical protein
MRTSVHYLNMHSCVRRLLRWTAKRPWPPSIKRSANSIHLSLSTGLCCQTPRNSKLVKRGRVAGAVRGSLLSPRSKRRRVLRRCLEWESQAADRGTRSRAAGFAEAYEHNFTRQTLDALALHARGVLPRSAAPRFQAIFCIDEREESMRRHLEELAPDVVTFSIAGFYFLDMYYRGAEDAHFVPLCPAVMRPQHWVVERPLAHADAVHQRRARARWALGTAWHLVHVGSRTPGLGALLSAAVGVLASAPLISRTLFPRLTARLRKAFGRAVLAAPLTRLQLERRDPTPGPEAGQVGYTLDEMTAIAERVLRDTGLTSGFAPLVFTFGHGSTSARLADTGPTAPAWSSLQARPPVSGILPGKSARQQDPFAVRHRSWRQTV